MKYIKNYGIATISAMIAIGAVYATKYKSINARLFRSSGSDSSLIKMQTQCSASSSSDSCKTTIMHKPR